VPDDAAATIYNLRNVYQIWLSPADKARKVLYNAHDLTEEAASCFLLIDTQ
jgi:hypothetical protein